MMLRRWASKKFELKNIKENLSIKMKNEEKIQKKTRENKEEFKKNDKVADYNFNNNN